MARMSEEIIMGDMVSFDFLSYGDNEYASIGFAIDKKLDINHGDPLNIPYHIQSCSILPDHISCMMVGSGYPKKVAISNICTGKIETWHRINGEWVLQDAE